MKKKIILGIAAAGTALAMLPLFAAFEAHVINVTAKIENALAVQTDWIDFGTVFPQEHLNQPLAIELSQSFKDEDRVDDVNYFIRQKPKCAITKDNGTTLVDEPLATTGHIEIIENQETRVNCGVPPRILTEGETWGLLPSLCEYISKDGGEEDGRSDENDGTTPSFHKPWVIVQGDDPSTPNVETSYIDYTDTPGKLIKSLGDEIDNWVIDLAVPCFGGFCAQDWENFVHGINPEAIPAEYTQLIANEHKVFGCDLWVEVSGVSVTPTPTPTPSPTPTPRPEVGANLSDYVAPTCNVTVSTTDSIQTAVTAAGVGDVVCVDSTYDGSGDSAAIRIENSGVTLAATVRGVDLFDPVVLSASNVTITGFDGVIGQAESISEQAAFYLDNDADLAEISFNTVTSGTGVGILTETGAALGGGLIANNVISGASGAGIYTNPHTGVFTIEFNDINDNAAGIGGLMGATVRNNEFEHTTSGSEAIGIDSTFDSNVAIVNFNNFLNDTEYNDYGAVAIADAENNFWSTSGVSQTTAGQIDFTPEEASAFPHN